MKVCLVSEWLTNHGDEGISNFARNLSQYLQLKNEVLEIGAGPEFNINRLFFSIKLQNMLKRFEPEIIFYISPSCANTTALLRAKVLKAYTPEASVFVISLQPVRKLTHGRTCSTLELVGYDLYY